MFLRLAEEKATKFYGKDYPLGEATKARVFSHAP